MLEYFLLQNNLELYRKITTFKKKIDFYIKVIPIKVAPKRKQWTFFNSVKRVMLFQVKHIKYK